MAAAQDHMWKWNREERGRAEEGNQGEDGSWNHLHIWSLICTNRSTSTLTRSCYFSLQEGPECCAGGGERTRQRQHRRDRSTRSCQWEQIESMFVVGSAATSELTTVGDPFSQWERHLTAILANFNQWFPIHKMHQSQLMMLIKWTKIC